MSSPASVPGRRLDIQGLRAIAVLFVLAYHCGLPMPGGFVGVDMFFGISGFVIAAMLMREHSRSRRIRLGQFYLRRFKRLTPALALVVAVTALLSLAFLQPEGQQQLGLATGLGALFLAANVVIHSWSGDYFAPVGVWNPLLHTWSLSVEEQFYLVFPALLVALFALERKVFRRWGRLMTIAILAGIALASLASIRGIPGLEPRHFLTGYYGPLVRAWEFLAGVLLALMVARCTLRHKGVATLVGAAGLLLVVASSLVITPETPFPGKWALLPVVATMLVILAGSHDQNPVTRALSVRPLVRIGDWSYSLYLWHWPLIVIAQAIWPLSSSAPVIAAALSFVPAYLSYRFVEDPLRRMELPSARVIVIRIVQLVGVPLLALAVAMGGLVWMQTSMAGGVLASRFGADPRERGSTTATVDCEWSGLRQLVSVSGRCIQTKPGSSPSIVLVGDSHADHLLYGLAQLYPGKNIAVVSFHSPRPFGGASGVKQVVDDIGATSGVRLVVVSWLLDQSKDGVPPMAREGLRQLAEGLVVAGKEVMMFDDIPQWPTDVFSCAYRRSLVLPGVFCSRPRLDLEDRHRLVQAQLKQMFPEGSGVKIQSTFWTFCTAETCRRADEDALLYSDQNHLTPSGSRRLWEALLSRAPEVAAAVAES